MQEPFLEWAADKEVKFKVVRDAGKYALFANLGRVGARMALPEQFIPEFTRLIYSVKTGVEHESTRRAQSRSIATPTSPPVN